METGQLQVWWVPQVPMTAFEVNVGSVQEGAKLLDVLAEYDLFQYENKVKPDYCNAGGLRRWCADSDGEGTPGWEDWRSEEHTSELQSLMRSSYAVFCLKKKKKNNDYS